MPNDSQQPSTAAPPEAPLQRGALVRGAPPREVASVEQLITSPALALWFDDRLFDRARTIAKYLSEAEGMVPRHLIGKQAACFAVVSRALTWKLDPYAVAACTYQTPGGSVGFEGKLIQAILENSGKLVGGLEYKHFGDWGRVKGKWELARSQKGNEYPKATWTRQDAKGLGVVISAQVKGEVDRRSLTFDLEDCFPLNSTLWATRPSQQICYTGARAFGNMAMPGVLMGVPFEDDVPLMRDVTPIEDAPARPTRADIVSGRAPPLPVEEQWEFTNEDGETVGCRGTTQFEELLVEALRHAPNVAVASGLLEANTATLNLIKAIPGAAEAVERIGEAVAAAQARFNAAAAEEQNTQGPSGNAREAPSSEGVQPVVPPTAGATGAAPESAGAATAPAAAKGGGDPSGPKTADTSTTSRSSDAAPAGDTTASGGEPPAADGFDAMAVYESLLSGLHDQRSTADIDDPNNGYLKLNQALMLQLRDHDKKLSARLDKKVAEHREKVRRK